MVGVIVGLPIAEKAAIDKESGKDFARGMGLFQLLARMLLFIRMDSTLFISPETVKWHTRRVYRKLGVATKIELVQRVLAETTVQLENRS